MIDGTIWLNKVEFIDNSESNTVTLSQGYPGSHVTIHLHHTKGREIDQIEKVDRLIETLRTMKANAVRNASVNEEE